MEGDTMTSVHVFGSVNLDVVVGVAKLPRSGETIMGNSLIRGSGGKGGNQAYAAARTAAPGIPVHLVACVGSDDAGTKLLSDLVDAGVGTSSIARVAGPSGTALITVGRSGENTIVVFPGANHSWPTELVSSVPIAHGDVVVCQLEVPLAIVAAAAANTRSAGGIFVLNAAPFDARGNEVLGLVDVLIVNEIEAFELLGLSDSESVEDLRSAAAVARCDLVVTLGGRGAVVATTKGEVTTIPAFAVNVIDTVGAGDAFVGALAVGLASGVSLVDAARAGSAAGAVTATWAGARSPALDSDSIKALRETG